MNRKAFTLLVVGAVLSSLVAAPVAAQTIQLETVLLDQDAEEVGEVQLDGRTYQIYTIESTLWYADGVEVYSDGDKVTSESEAQAAIRAHSQRQAIAGLDADGLAALRALERDTEAMSNAMAPTTAELDDTMLLVDELKAQPVEGDRTAWEAAVNASSALEEFNGTQEPALREDVREWRRAADHLHANTTALVDLLEQRENGVAVDTAVLYHQYVATMDALATFEDRTDQLARGLSGTATSSGDIATGVYGVPDHGEGLSDQFVQLGHQLRLSSTSLLDVTAPVSEHGDALGDPQALAESTQRELVDDWRTRSTAATKVYQTVVAVPLLFVALGSVFFRRRLWGWASISLRDLPGRRPGD